MHTNGSTNQSDALAGSNATPSRPPPVYSDHQKTNDNPRPTTVATSQLRHETPAADGLPDSPPVGEAVVKSVTV